MPQNLIEKIVEAYALDLQKGDRLHAGDTVFIAPEHILTHDNSSAVMLKFQALGATSIADSRQPVLVLDHNVQDHGQDNLSKYSRIETFARAHNLDFYPAGRGIGHQVMCEEGYVWPGTLVVASDSHANMYGGLGALGTPVVRTDAAAIWATGQTWWQIPPVVKVVLKGGLQAGVTGKDVIIALAGHFNQDEVLNHAIEFGGDGVSMLSIDERLTIANMTTEWGALAGVFPADARTISWLEARAKYVEHRGLAGVPSDIETDSLASPRLNRQRISQLKLSLLQADAKATYAKEIHLDLTTLVPHVSGPDHVKTMTPVDVLSTEEIRIDKAYLLSCVNSRVGDLAEAARIVQDRRVADHVEFYVAAASQEIQEESRQRGDWQILMDAGAIPLPSGCGPCIGLGAGLLEENEVGISATNRNFKGRMGASSARTYLASPAVVAASAVAGKIVAPSISSPVKLQAQLITHPSAVQGDSRGELLEGFPGVLTGNLVFCPADNLNTDGIFPGKYTYLDDLTEKQLADAAMENYDSTFTEQVQQGDILLGGYNFGTGSSREQAVTALIHCGISMVLAGSFSATYKRNALNNGLLVMEAPELLEDLMETYGRHQATVATGKTIRLDLQTGVLTFSERSYALSPVGHQVQELIRAQGLENWVRERLT